MLEKDIVRAILKELRGAGAFAIKTHGSPQFAGLPDIIGCLNGRFFALEVKRPGGYYGVTDRQQAVLDQVTVAGGIAKVVTSVEDVKYLLELSELGQSKPPPEKKA